MTLRLESHNRHVRFETTPSTPFDEGDGHLEGNVHACEFVNVSVVVLLWCCVVLCVMHCQCLIDCVRLSMCLCMCSMHVDVCMYVYTSVVG